MTEKTAVTAKFDVDDLGQRHDARVRMFRVNPSGYGDMVALFTFDDHDDEIDDGDEAVSLLQAERYAKVSAQMITAAHAINPTNPSAVAAEIVPMRDALVDARNELIGCGNIFFNMAQGGKQPSKDDWERYREAVDLVQNDIGALLSRLGANDG